MGRSAAARTPPHARRRHHGVPRLGACRTQAAARRNERAAARDGGDTEFRPVQSRPPDLCGVEACGYRTVVWAAIAQLVLVDRLACPPDRAIAQEEGCGYDISQHNGACDVAHYSGVPPRP